MLATFLTVISETFFRKTEMWPKTTTPTKSHLSVSLRINDNQLKAATLAREGQEIFMAAVFAFHTGKTVVQIPAIEITMDHLLDIGPPESVLT